MADRVKLAAYSCGGSRGFGQRPHHVPFFVPPVGVDDRTTIAAKKSTASARGASALTKRRWRPLSARDRRSLIRERTGNAVRNECSKAAAAPATVGGEPVPNCHWDNPGKAVTGGEPRARRPTGDSVVARAGCFGAGRFASSTRIAASALRSGTRELYRKIERDRCASVRWCGDRIRMHHLPTSGRPRHGTAARRDPGGGDGESCGRQRRRDQAGAVPGELHARLERCRALQWLLDICLRRPRRRLRISAYRRCAPAGERG